MFSSRALPTWISGSFVGQLALFTVLYFGVDVALNTFVLGDDGWQIFWPLNGLSIALLLMRPRRQWSLFLLTTGVSTGLGELLCHTELSVVLIDGFASALEIVLGVLLLPPFTDIETWLREPRLYPRFTLAVVVGPLLVTALEAAVVMGAQGLPFTATFLNYAPSDVIGVAVMVPLILSLPSVRPQLLEVRWWGRVFIVLGATVGVMMAMFLGDQFPLLFLLYPFLMWVEGMLGLFGSSIALTCACVLGAVLTQEGYGPFAHAFAPGTVRNLSVDIYLAFHLVCFLPVSILSVERQRLTRELRAALKRATALATVDGLTGISNRRTFESRLGEQWELARRNRTSLALLMVDVDHFKRFNDTLGHQAGDECLRAVAQALEAKVARPTDLVARFGGEEFVILLPDTSLKGAICVAETVRTAVLALAIDHSNTPSGRASEARCVTVSVGCAALVPDANVSSQDLIARADDALYSAKRMGRNRVCSAPIAPGTDAALPAMRRLQERINALKAQS